MSITLENDYLSIDMDQQTGAIVSLFNKKTQWELIRQPKLSCGIRLLVPTKEYRNNKVLSQHQQLSQYNMDKNSDNSQQCTLLWQTVTANHTGILPITVELNIRLIDETIEFRAQIDNKSNYIVEEFWAPCLGGIREPYGTQPLKSKMVNQIASFNEQTLGDGFHSWGYFGVDHPTTINTYPGTNCQLPFMLLEHENQGVYIGMHSEEIELVSFIHELVPGYTNSCHTKVPQGDEIGEKPAGFVISVAQMPFIQPGDKKVLSPIVLSLYQGTWHKGIECYKQWRNTWFNKRPQPQWANAVDCWMTLQMNSSEDCCKYSYNELPSLMRKAKKQGVQALQLIGWAIGGQDGIEPIQDTDHRLGTRDELRSAIKEIEAMGIHVLLMCKFKWVDQSYERYEEDLIDYTLKDMYGNPTQFGGYIYQTISQHLNGASRRTGTGLCHLSEGYRDFALREFDKIVDLKPSGILYDELSSDLLICFDKTHGHRWGESHFKGTAKLVEEFYEYVHHRDSEFLFAGEGVIDPIAQYYSVNYIRSSGGTWGGPNYTPVGKYVNNDMKYATCIIGFDDREMINQCLVQGHIINYEALNFKGTLDEMPLTIEYGQKALKLRRLLWDYIWEGKYLDTLGATIQTQTIGAQLIYSVFENINKAKKAYVVANQSDIQIEIELITMDQQKNYYVYDIETCECVESLGMSSIPPRSLIVFVEV